MLDSLPLFYNIFLYSSKKTSAPKFLPGEKKTILRAFLLSIKGNIQQQQKIQKHRRCLLNIQRIQILGRKLNCLSDNTNSERHAYLDTMTQLISRTPTCH